MIIEVGNIASKAIIGGKDYLLRLDKELREYLRVRPKNYNFSTAYKPDEHGKRRWDGYKNLINAKGEFATGFFPAVYKFSEEVGAEVKVVDKQMNIPETKATLDYSFGGLQLADHQIMMVDKLMTNEVAGIKFRRGLWDAATNAGKTVVLGAAFSNVVNGRLIMLVNRQDLFNQHYKAFSEFMPVGRISSKHYDIQDFTLAMVGTLKNRMKDMSVLRDMNTFNMLCVDECHDAGAAYYSFVLQRINAGMRIFMSGTPLDSDDPVRKLIIIGLSGPALVKITKKELMDKGWSLKIKVYIHLNNTKSDALSFTDEQEDVVMLSESRADKVVEIIKVKQGKKILVTFFEIGHGEFMYNAACRAGVVCDITHGEDPDREQKLQDYIDGKIMILFSSSIMQQGLNIRDISVLIYCQGGKSKIRVSQFSGRIERNDGVSEYAEIHDFYDCGRWVSAHSAKRINIYKKEDFEINFEYENKRGRPSGAGVALKG